MEQSYSNHRRFIILYHFVLFFVIIATLIGSGVNLYKSMGTSGLYSASLIFSLSLSLLVIYAFARIFALKAQDRAINAEENLRHFVMTQSLLDTKLSIRQIVGLRFAGDDEFVELAKKAAADDMSEDDIKKAIKNWKGDTYRV